MQLLGQYNHGHWGKWPYISLIGAAINLALAIVNGCFYVVEGSTGLLLSALLSFSVVLLNLLFEPQRDTLMRIILRPFPKIEASASALTGPSYLERAAVKAVEHQLRRDNQGMIRVEVNRFSSDLRFTAWFRNDAALVAFRLTHTDDYTFRGD